jgi:hypothetical protein
MPYTWEEHKKLYHYTNWDGVLGILTTKSLWATHYRFLNDSSEFTLFRDRLISLLKPAVQEECTKQGRRDPSSFATDFVRILVNDYYRVTGAEAVLPWSWMPESCGTCSQWRGRDFHTI